MKTLKELLEKQIEDNQDEVVCPDIISDIQSELLGFIREWAIGKKHSLPLMGSTKDRGYYEALSDLITLIDEALKTK